MTEPHHDCPNCDGDGRRFWHDAATAPLCDCTWSEISETPQDHPTHGSRSVDLVLRFADGSEAHGWLCHWTGYTFLASDGPHNCDDTSRGLPTHWRVK